MAIIAILAEVEGSKELETINGHDFRNLDRECRNLRESARG